MKLSIRHTFGCSPARYWEMYWSDSFDALLEADSTVDRELVEESSVGDVTTRRLRFTPRQELPSAVASLLGTSKLVYEQENRFDRARSAMDWRVIPTILPGKLDARGTLAVKPSGASCEQVVDGVITVQVPLIGSRIEKAVVAEVERSYEKMADAVRAWLRTHGA